MLNCRGGGGGWGGGGGVSCPGQFILPPPPPHPLGYQSKIILLILITPQFIIDTSSHSNNFTLILRWVGVNMRQYHQINVYIYQCAPVTSKTFAHYSFSGLNILTTQEMRKRQGVSNLRTVTCGLNNVAY